MLSRFSVRKPYTIFVIVVLIIVFGVVAFTKTTMDLMPNIDMPYVAVMTADPGATPRQVEKTVTEPMEQQMATLDDLKNVSSMSQDNYSLIMLEFNSDADLDVVSSDIRDKIDLVSGNFDDSVQKPVIYKLNPNIMPIVIASVTDKGKNTVETSTLMEEELQRRLEGTDGVAAVTTAGLVDDKVHIALSQEKIDAVNARLRKAAGALAGKAEKQVDEGISKSRSGQKQIEYGQQQIEKAQQDLAVKKELISKALKSLQTLAVSRDAVRKMQPGMDTSLLDEQIDNIVKQLRPYSADLKKVGIDIDKAASSGREATKAVSAFDIAMSFAQDQMGNKMSDLAGMSAYLKSLENQLQGSKTQIEAQKKQAEQSADVSGLLTMDNLSRILTAQNFEMPAGYVSDDGHDVMVTVGDKLDSLQDISNLVLVDPGIRGVAPVRIRDVATVSYLNNGEDSYAKNNGQEGLLVTFNKQSGYSTTEAAGNIMDKFGKLEKEYKGLRFTVLSNQGKYIKEVINNVLENLLVGALLAILILFLFLRDLKPTLITVLSIPISVTFAFVLMYFSGVTLNVISMSGLAVGIGMLVDNSIVVIENIYRLRAEGYSRMEAAMKGASQVAGAITASTLTTVSVFIPIVFVQGITRQVFMDMALTVSYSLLASLFIALTLVPVIGSSLLKNIRQNTLLSQNSRFIAKYKKFVRTALDHKAVVLVLALVLLVASVATEASRGLEYIPAMSTDEISATLEMPAKTGRDKCFEAYDEISSAIQRMKGVKTVGIMLEADIGSSMGFAATSGGSKDYNTASLYILMKKSEMDRSDEVGRAMKKLAREHGGEMSVSNEVDVTSSSALGGGGISLDVDSDDLDALRVSAQRIEKKMRSMKGLTNVSDSREDTVPELRITIDKSKAIRQGLTTAQVYAGISSALSAERKATTIELNGSDRDVVLSEMEGRRLTEDQLLKKTITATDATGKTVRVKLDDIAGVSEDETLKVIHHKSQKRTINVTAAIAKGYNTTKMNDKVEKAVAGMDLPDSISVDYGGRNAAIMDAMKQLGLMMALGILLIYLIMVAQFQSLKQPFVVMFTVPLAFTGGLLALLLTGNVISVVSMIGFIMLVGIIVNNAIVLIDYTNQLRAEGVELREAIVQAGATRLRPILMTALTTVLGLLPLSLGIGSGTEMMQPVAIVCIGGLLYATLMTLLVIPCMYEIMSRVRKPKKNRGFEMYS